MPTVIERAGGHIGSVVSSVLTETQFQALHGTGWVLMDGRSCVGSTYATITGQSTIPDARGMVLRGKNNGRSDGNQDPSGERAVGNLQNDSIQGHYHDKSETNHSHGVSDSGHSHGGVVRSNGIAAAGSAVGGNIDFNGTTSSATTGISIQGTTSNVSITNPSSDGVNGAPRTSSETRMRNIAVNHFIKIN